MFGRYIICYTHQYEYSLIQEQCFSYCILCSPGIATGMIINTGDRTIIGRIASLASGVGNEKTPIAIEIEHFVDIIAGLAIFFGFTFFVVAMFIGYAFLEAMIFFMAIVVAYVPEGLLATVTVSYPKQINFVSTLLFITKFHFVFYHKILTHYLFNVDVGD